MSPDAGLWSAGCPDDAWLPKKKRGRDENENGEGGKVEKNVDHNFGRNDGDRKHREKGRRSAGESAQISYGDTLGHSLTCGGEKARPGHHCMEAGTGDARRQVPDEHRGRFHRGAADKGGVEVETVGRQKGGHP